MLPVTYGWGFTVRSRLQDFPYRRTGRKEEVSVGEEKEEKKRRGGKQGSNGKEVEKQKRGRRTKRRLKTWSRGGKQGEKRGERMEAERRRRQRRGNRERKGCEGPRHAHDIHIHSAWISPPQLIPLFTPPHPRLPYQRPLQPTSYALTTKK